MAQLPNAQLFAVAPTGGQQGATFDLMVTAAGDQDGVAQLHFSHPGISAVAKLAPLGPLAQKADPQPGQFTVTIAPDVPVGLYDVRVVGTYGISNPRAFVVGDRPESRDPGGNNTRQTAAAVEMDTVINGTADATATDWYKFTAAAGQRVLVDCWGQRIDSRIDATLVMYDSRGRELERSRDAVRRDALLDVTIPADGEYYVQVYDFVYSGVPEYFYRLSLGMAPVIDYILPPCGVPGTTAEYAVYGRNLPGGTPVEGLTVDQRPLERLLVQIPLPPDDPAKRESSGGLVEPEDSMLDGIEYRLPSPHGSSNPFFIGFATAPPVLEVEPNSDPASAQKVVVPAEVAGQFDAPGDHDWIEFEAAAGDVFWIEVFSQRLGLPTDPIMLVQQVTRDAEGKEQVADLQEADDDATNIGGFSYYTPTEDPLISFQAPQTASYRILLRDLHHSSRSDPRQIYRLSIRRPNPDFRLTALCPFPSATKTEARPWSPLLRAGGTVEIDVMAFRRDGFAGPIEVVIEGLPEGVTCPGGVIASGQSLTTLVLAASETAPSALGAVRIVGRGKVGETDVTREARAGSVLFASPVNTPAPGRMARELLLAVNGVEPAPFLVELGEGKSWEMSRAGKLLIPVKVIRRGEIKANLTCVPLGLPPDVAPTALALDANTNQANLELAINPGAPLGTYSIYLQVQTTIGYRRNLAAADAAAKEKEVIDKLAADLTAAAEAAAAAKLVTDTAAIEADTALQTAVTAKDTATAAATKAAEEVLTADAAVTAAKTALDADANNQDLATALQTAQQAQTAAAERAKVALEAQTAAETAATQAAEKAKLAAEAKAAADAKAAETAAKAQEGALAKAAAEKKAADTAAASNPADLALFAPSTATTLKITPAPITLAPPAPPGALAQGSQVELPVTINRLYAYADAVNVEVVLPGSATGISVAAVSVPGDQTECKLIFSAAADAAPGTYTVTIRGTAPFNGQNLQAETTVALVVTAAAAN